MTDRIPWSERVEAAGIALLFDQATKLRQARFQCASCPAHFDVTLNVHLLPEVLAKKAHDEGWTDKRRRWLCPGCSRPRKGNGEAKMAIPVASVPGGLKNGKDDHKDMADNPPMVPALELAKRSGREPTIKETLEIGNALEMYFDKAKGTYSNDKSDEVISRELNMPRAWIENVRKQAFGELKADPEVEALAADITRLEADLVGLRGVIKNIEERVGNARVRLRKLEERR